MDVHNKHIDYIDLINRYLTNEINGRETILLEEWVLESEENKNFFNKFKKTWALSNTVKSFDIDVNAEWNKIQNKIFSSSKETTIQNIRQKNNNFNFIFRIAAVVVLSFSLVFSAYYFINKSKYNTFVADNYVVTQKISDGSIITLNNNSKITVPKEFDKNVRKVKLKGDAFFDVKHDETKPFIIETGKIEIQVLGTSFYVKSQKNSPTIEVIVKTGKVAVRLANNPQKEIILKPDEKGIFVKNKNKLKKINNTDVNYLSWKTKFLIFKNEKLKNVVNKLNETYHTHIIITNPKINNCTITATFNNKSIGAVLNILKETLDLEIKRQKNAIYVSGNSCE
ncbi:MAG: hypothetical protein DRJ01_10010 [Bacteroidetes bacterium]|nr:MAG: hypothetical protein DRJ01_10010 [Bacteroidota bacterium]